MLKEPTDRCWWCSSSRLMFLFTPRKWVVTEVHLDGHIRPVYRDWRERDGTIVDGHSSVLTLNTVCPVTGVRLTGVEVVDVDLVDVLDLHQGTHGDGVTQVTVTVGLRSLPCPLCVCRPDCGLWSEMWVLTIVIITITGLASHSQCNNYLRLSLNKKRCHMAAWLPGQ